MIKKLYRVSVPSSHPGGGANRQVEVYAEDDNWAVTEAIKRIHAWPYWVGGCGYTSHGSELINLAWDEEKGQVSPSPGAYKAELILNSRERRVFRIGRPVVAQ